MAQMSKAIPTCMSCRMLPAIKKVRTNNGLRLQWRCASCAKRKSPSFISAGERHATNNKQRPDETDP